MKKTGSIILSLIFSVAININIIAAAEAPVIQNTVSKLNNDSIYSFSDHLKRLSRFSNVIEKNYFSPRWKEVPLNLAMVYLWAKDNYHEDSLLPLAENWIRLSNSKSGKYSDHAVLANIFANLIKHNFFQAEKAFSNVHYNKETEFLTLVAKALIGSSKKTKASLNGNNSFSFTYNIRVTHLNDARDIVKKYPESALGHYILAMNLQQKETQKTEKQDKNTDSNEAITEINKAIQLEPNNLLFTLKKAEFIFDETHSEEAVKEFNNLYELSFKDSYVAEEIGDFFARNKQIDNAINYITLAIKQDKGRTGLYKKINSLYGFYNKVEPVIEIYENALKQFPEKEELYMDLAELYQKNDASNKVIIELFTKAVKANPQNSDLHLSLGDAYYLDKNTEKSLQEYQTAITLNNKNTEAYGKLISIFKDKDDENRVIELANEALLNNPDYSMGYLWIGSVFLKQNKFDDAIKIIQKSVETNPNFVIGYNSLGLAYKAAKKFDFAIEQFKKALELNASYLDALLNLGDTYMQKGDYLESEKIYQQALNSEPYNDSIYFSLGNLYTEAKKFEQAENAFLRAILINPSSLDARNNLGNVYLKESKFDNAIGEFERILALNEKYATAYYNIACALSLKKEVNNSLTYLGKALSIDKNLKEVAKTDPDFDNIRNETGFKNMIN